MSPDAPKRPRAVLMDLDGTLYHQAPLRRRMLAELLATPLTRGPRGAWRTFRHLKVFRSVREELRELGRPEESLDELQYAAPAGRLGASPFELRATVEEWIHERPLRHIARSRRADLVEFLERTRERGLPIGLFSDYPGDAKLEALGVRGHFDLCLCATDPEINAFKPHPRGFERACELWGFEPSEVLYVGDRSDVDAGGAHAAGMPAAILTDGHTGTKDASGGAYSYTSVASLAEVSGVLDA